MEWSKMSYNRKLIQNDLKWATTVSKIVNYCCPNRLKFVVLKCRLNTELQALGFSTCIGSLCRDHGKTYFGSLSDPRERVNPNQSLLHVVYSFGVMSPACYFLHICMQHAGPLLLAHSSDSCFNASFDSAVQIMQHSCFIRVENC